MGGEEARKGVGGRGKREKGRQGRQLAGSELGEQHVASIEVAISRCQMYLWLHCIIVYAAIVVVSLVLLVVVVDVCSHVGLLICHTFETPCI